MKKSFSVHSAVTGLLRTRVSREWAFNADVQRDYSTASGSERVLVTRVGFASKRAPARYRSRYCTNVRLRGESQLASSPRTGGQKQAPPWRFLKSRVALSLLTSCLLLSSLVHVSAQQRRAQRPAQTPAQAPAP